MPARKAIATVYLNPEPPPHSWAGWWVKVEPTRLGPRFFGPYPSKASAVAKAWSMADDRRNGIGEVRHG